MAGVFVEEKGLRVLLFIWKNNNNIGNSKTLCCLVTNYIAECVFVFLTCLILVPVQVMYEVVITKAPFGHNHNT